MADDALQPDAAQAAGLALTPQERDTVGEINNISMGAAASTLTMLLNQEVEISTPQIAEFATIAELGEPFAGDEKLLVSFEYLQGFSSSCIMIFKAPQAKVIADMMLGGTGEVESGPLNDLQLSAVSEATSQMMNASATSLASVLSKNVEVRSPLVEPFELAKLQQVLATACGDKGIEEALTALTFDIKVGNTVTLDILQIWLSQEAKSQVKLMLAIQPDEPAPPAPASTPEPVVDLQPAAAQAPPPAPPPMAPDMPPPGQMPYGAAPYPPPPQGYPPQGGYYGYAQQPPPMQANPVTVQPVQFSSFDEQPAYYGESNKNLQLVMDVTLNVTVELGRTEIPIKEVLELTRGSVIELERLAGEPVDLLANGKLIAKGEVVVIEDNFGLRITSIVSPSERLKHFAGG